MSGHGLEGNNRNAERLERAEEAELLGNITRINELTKGEGWSLPSESLDAIQAEAEKLEAEINHTLRERIENWTFQAGIFAAVAPLPFVGSPGGLAGMAEGGTRALWGAGAAGVLSLGIWSVQCIKLWVKQQKNKTETPSTPNSL